MKNDQNKIASGSEQIGSNPLTHEIQRAVEVMGRVKKSDFVREINNTKHEQGFSYLLPPPVLLCLPS
jgi:hypothetical protein